MRRFYALAALLMLTVCLLPHAARANARLVSVTPIGGGCVSGPLGPGVEAWDVQPGQAYLLRFEHVTDAGHCGMDATLSLLVMNSAIGNTPIVAARIGPGIYVATIIMPTNACETLPIRYGVVNNAPGTGILCGRHDDGTFQSHLRLSTFGPGCTNPQPIHCFVTPVVNSTWGALKSIYR